MLCQLVRCVGVALLLVTLAACGSTPTPSTKLVYQAPGGLAMATTDGGSPQALPLAGFVHPHHPDISPTSDKFVFVADDAADTSDIWIANIDGSEARMLVACERPCDYVEDPAWSPDGTRIAYWRSDSVTQVIEVMDVASGTLVATLPAQEGIGPVGPRWSPDGRQLVVEVGRYDTGTNELLASWLATIDLSSEPLEMRPITPDTMLAAYPDWSWAADRIVFQAGNAAPFARAGQPTNIYTINPDGSNMKQVTQRGSGEPWLALPAWTPDGQRILATLIHSTSHFTIASVALDGAVTELLDSRGTPLEGAHPRVAGR